MDSASTGRPSRQTPASKLRRVLRRDSKATDSSTPTRAANLLRREMLFSHLVAIGMASTIPARKMLSSCGDGAARARWKPRATKFRRKVIERGLDFSDANPAWEDPRIASGMKPTTQLQTRVAAFGQEASGLEAGVRRTSRVAAPAYQRTVGWISHSRRRAPVRLECLSPGWKKPAAEPEIAVYLRKDLGGTLTVKQSATQSQVWEPRLNLPTLIIHPKTWKARWSVTFISATWF